MVFIVFVIFIVLFSSFVFGITPSTDKELIVMLSLNLITILVFFSSKETSFFYKKNYFKHSNLLILSFLIVFFQIAVEYLAGNIDLGNDFLIPRPDVFFKTVHVLSISFVTFFLGYLISKKIKFRETKSVRPKNTLFLYLGSVLSFILYVFVTDKSYFMGSYAETKFTPLMVYSSVLYVSFTTAYLVQKSVNIRLSNSCFSLKEFIFKIDKLIIVAITLYLGLVLMSGDRGPFIFMSMVCLVVFMYATRIKLKLKVIAPMIVFAVVLIMFIGIARAPFLIGASFSEKLDYVLEVKDRIPFVSPATMELASSFRTANVVVAEVSSKTDYFYGSFFIRTILSIIPGLSGLLIEFFYSDLPNYMNTPASYVTYLIQGASPRYGDGASAITDIYLDFGVAGCVFFFFFFGASIRGMEKAVFGKKPGASIFLLVVSVCYFAMAIRTGRASILEPFITAVRVLIFIYLNNILVKGLKKG
ncbi:O-antigen polysaccharide polymerase Wzy [Tenacibaculum finnmarkense]|uniref:O-antigen polysaccharide polymerase Wzy n=1 Tax=Tenacibaculum finnmarkense genomovar finnmarkense TaxID=1458503 RepID=A0AAP1RES5_9FLAO|nr:O-antigen polysaccharide polymerase Wzy [Tenacibaculum finnmarkense]MBE7652744.1 O-antigen polysaccharide polymerase Wzy [Tenacibaculum finnmarkense genomovar finnmarkense]MBE7694979.1 O-antigen polysaccharide polymerase Wzy [Tenacibaculum finnmarkense genomovar finnmarkense]MCD8439268.1 O-antigen polysaccharide polymerase Wzy family protein [Tenacibaculum finnmarkense genomovar ulcerans]MCG8185837.1 O-antigen polysaccharide polymerase Wzy [Tenacibaculum finnmarkense genomovar finnmarkense]